MFHGNSPFERIESNVSPVTSTSSHSILENAMIRLASALPGTGKLYQSVHALITRIALILFAKQNQVERIQIKMYD